MNHLHTGWVGALVAVGGGGLGRLWRMAPSTHVSHMHGQATSSPLVAASVAEQPNGTAWLVPATNDLQFSSGYINEVETGGNNFINGFLFNLIYSKYYHFNKQPE